MSDFLRQIVYMSDEHYQEMMNSDGKRVTVNGVTVEYSENDIYVVADTESE